VWGLVLRVRVDGLARTLTTAIARTLHDNLMGVVREPIERTLGEDGIIKERDPFLDRRLEVTIFDARVWRSITTS
jgi:hypothetical protein